MLQVNAFNHQYLGALGALGARSQPKPIHIPGFSAQAQHITWLSGASGCGKTTALNLIAGLIPVAQGQVWVNGQDIGALTAIARDRWRGGAVGFVPQEPQLIDSLSALQNVVLPAQLAGVAARAPQHVTRLLSDLGLAQVKHHTPNQLSRGQQQRVAIARAFAGQPALLLADEPTANLDDTHAHAVMALLQSLCQLHHCTAVVASHDARVALYCTQKVVFA